MQRQKDNLFINVERQFINSKHVKNGIQTWNDGSAYEGSYSDCFRHGFGNQTWQNGENYHGQFFNDFFHGFGLYSWANGSFYLGTFYMDQREGYGLQYDIKNNTCYEGLFRENMVVGTGRLVYFDDESMDLGFWKNDKLIKFFKDIPDFHLLEMASFMHNKTFVSLDDLKLECDILNENLIKKCDEISLDENEIFVNFLPRNSLSVNKKLFNEAFVNSVDVNNEFFKDVLGETVKEILLKISEISITPLDDYTDETFKKVSDDDDIFVVWNKTLSSVLMQKHVLQFRQYQNRVSFDIDLLLSKTHLDYKRGLLERLSTEFLECCLGDNVGRVKELLKENMIFVDICDINGNSPLIGAAMNGHTEIINILLNSGAEINRMNDFGVTALMAACLCYYVTSDNVEIGSTFHDLLCNFRSLYPKLGSNNVNTNNKQSKFNDQIKIDDSNVELGKLNVKRRKSNLTVEQIWFGTEEFPEENGLGLIDLVNQNLKSRQGFTTFHSTIELLLKRGADPNLSLPCCSALHLAILTGDTQSVKLLLEKGSDHEMPLLLKDGVEIKPLHIACSLSSKESVEIVELVLSAGADANVTTSPIGQVSNKNNSNNKTSTTRDMPRNNSNNNVQEDECFKKMMTRVPIELVCLRNDEDSSVTSQLLQLLIDHEVNMNCLFSDGLSPLAHCLLNKKYELARHLLENGADPNMPLGGGYKNALCLSVVAETNPTDQLTLIDLLVQNGADVTLPINMSDGKKTGNFIDYIHRFYAQNALNSELPYHDGIALKKSKQAVLDYLSNAVKRKLSETYQLDKVIGGDPICCECGRSSFSKSTCCPKCQSAIYCGKACRSKSWKESHKYHCTDTGHETGKYLSPNCSRSENVSKMTSRSLTSASTTKGLKNNFSAQSKGSQNRLHQMNLKSFTRNKSSRSKRYKKNEMAFDQTNLNYASLSKYIQEFNSVEANLSGVLSDFGTPHKLNKADCRKIKSDTADMVFVGNYSYI